MSAAQRTEHVGIFSALLKGWDMGKGEGGVLYVHGEKCAFCMPDAFPEYLEKGLRAAIETDKAKKFFFVLVQNEQQVDMVTYEREHVKDSVAKWSRDLPERDHSSP